MLILYGSTALGISQDAEATTVKESAPAKKEDAKADFRADITKIVQSYADSFNAQDAEKVAAHWTENGVYVSQPSGEEVAGRTALKSQMIELFKEDEKRKLDLQVDSLELISPNVVLQRGTSVVTTGDGKKIESTYRSIFVLQNGKWLIDRVTEDEAEESIPSHYEKLKPLEWLVGEWVDESEDHRVEFKTNFTTNRNFITRAYTVYTDGEVSTSGLEMIGWDSKKNQIRSWLFDSQGGFIERDWTEKGDRWLVQSVATLPGGKSGSYTAVFRPLKDGTYGWRKVNQQFDGQLLPNLAEVIISRKSEEER